MTIYPVLKALLREVIQKEGMGDLTDAQYTALQAAMQAAYDKGCADTLREKAQ